MGEMGGMSGMSGMGGMGGMGDFGGMQAALPDMSSGIERHPGVRDTLRHLRSVTALSQVCGGSSFSTSSYADAIGFSASRTRDYIKTLAENHV